METSDLTVSYFGGVLKKTYWTPDGRRIDTPPAMRGTINKATGKEGVRDANYDKGWLDTLPDNLKPHCNGCGDWHDTQDEVVECIKRKNTDNKKWAKAKPEAPDDRIEKLENDLTDIKSMLTKILEG